MVTRRSGGPVPRRVNDSLIVIEVGHLASPNAVAECIVEIRGIRDSPPQQKRLSGLSQARQCGLFTLRMLVMGAPPKAGGPGIPHRAIASSRTPSAAWRAV